MTFGPFPVRANAQAVVSVVNTCPSLATYTVSVTDKASSQTLLSGQGSLATLHGLRGGVPP